ncbi:hypothetical protein HUJ05_011028 [Dendroctonus ponderosae]|nr:hypothetical protein HUJ05_011028 [Dendroctonus ponderosae]
MSVKLRTRTPSPKTVTFDPSPPTTLERKRRLVQFRNLGTYGKTQPVAGGRLVGATGARPNNSSLVELDNLLEDLSTSRYANVPENGVNGAHSRPGSAQNSLDRPSSAQGAYNRPSVDDLLQELDQG